MSWTNRALLRIATSTKKEVARRYVPAPSATIATNNSPTTATMNALLHANLGLLGQKLELLSVLRKELGSEEEAKLGYAQICTIVGASIGQHFRHSMDHTELAVATATAAIATTTTLTTNRNNIAKIHYDRRARGGDDETNMEAAEKRIRRVKRMIEELPTITSALASTSSLSSSITSTPRKNNEAGTAIGSSCSSSSSNNNNNNNKDTVLACFVLSSSDDDDPSSSAAVDNNKEFLLSSTIERELGFVAHHTLHHLAMVKVIATHTLKLIPVDTLPKDFGKAPSTINYSSTIKM